MYCARNAAGISRHNDLQRSPYYVTRAISPIGTSSDGLVLAKLFCFTKKEGTLQYYHHATRGNPCMVLLELNGNSTEGFLFKKPILFRLYVHSLDKMKATDFEILLIDMTLVFNMFESWYLMW